MIIDSYTNYSILHESDCLDSSFCYESLQSKYKFHFKAFHIIDDDTYYFKKMPLNHVINMIIASPLFAMELLTPELVLVKDIGNYDLALGSKEIPMINAKALQTAHMSIFVSGVDIWSFDYTLPNISQKKCFKSIDDKIKDRSLECHDAEKGGLMNLLFQDSDVHSGNEHFVEHEGKLHYVRLDVDHADFVFSPTLPLIKRNLTSLLEHHKFSCESLTILANLLDKKSLFKASMEKSIDFIKSFFSDETIKNFYGGNPETFKNLGDETPYYKSLNISGSEELSDLIFNNFEDIFSTTIESLNEINEEASLSLLGQNCFE